MSQAIAEEQQQDPTLLTNKKRRFKPTLSGREVIGSLQAQQPGDAEEEEEERFSEDSEDLPPAKEEAPIPKRGRSTRTTASKALRTGDAPPLDWLPIDLGIKIFAAPNPKAKVDKEKKHQQLGAQRMLKLETRTTFAMFKGMLLAVVQEDKKETISGDWDNWLVEVSLHSAGHLFSEKTKLKNEEVFDDFIEAALQSSKRAATVLVKEIERLFTPAVASGASASSKKDDSRMKNIQDLQHVSDQLRQYDRQVVKRWICNASDCHHRSRAHPSCYIHPRNPQQHINLKCAHRFAWAAALADSAAGVTVDFPPATEIFMPKAGITKEEVAIEDQAEVSGGDEGGKRGSVRRKPLQPMTGPGSSFENSIDLDDYLKVKEEPGLIKVEESQSRDKENQLPAAGPDMDLETWIKECSASPKVATILLEAGYMEADELLHLEKDEEVLKDLKIEKTVAHQFAAAMTRWRRKSITATSFTSTAGSSVASASASTSTAAIGASKGKRKATSDLNDSGANTRARVD